MNLKLVVAAALCGLCASPSLAGQQNFPADSGLIAFSLPSGNIGCTYIPAGGTYVYVPKDGGPELQCDRVAPKYLRFFLRKSGKAEMFNNVGDASCCSAENVLSYGNTWKKDKFTCVSERTGLTCTRGDGHGFFISKVKTRVY